MSVILVTPPMTILGQDFLLGFEKRWRFKSPSLWSTELQTVGWEITVRRFAEWINLSLVLEDASRPVERMIVDGLSANR
jgi:hypothetical protein